MKKVNYIVRQQLKNMSEYKITSYEQLMKKLEDINSEPIPKMDGQIRKKYYRGHADKKWKLIPNILRKGEVCEQFEIVNFDNKSENSNIQAVLPVAQHYGKKTRCLDFTRNFKVALYFACNPNDPAYNEDGAIFVWEKDAHRPNWFTSYIAYYVATCPCDEVSSWDFSRYIISKKEVFDEFMRTKRSTRIDDVNYELQQYLGEGFMVDFEGYDYDKRITNQEAALFYFGSEYFEGSMDNKKIIKTNEIKIWDNTNTYYINLHKLFVLDIEKSKYCTKIIIPQNLKKEIYDKINIKAEDLGL